MNTHIMPVNDLFEHDSRGICACNPKVDLDIKSRSLLVIHNAWDGRERHEPDSKKYNSPIN